MTKLTPKNIEWTIADNKIIKKLNDWSFAEATASDITSLWFVSSVTEKTISLIASETINIWDHVSSWINNFWHNIDNWSVRTFSIVAWWSAPMSFGQTFNISEDWIITTIWSRFIYTDIWTLHWASYSISANIYNITWVYWSTAVNTWASLWSSNTLTWSVSPWWTITINALFDFWKVSLNAWNYAVVMTWTITAWWTWTNASFNVRWDLLNWYSWNFINWWVADWTKDMYFYVNYISNSYVQKADADDINRTKYIWQAVTWWNQWDTIIIKTRWVLSQTWATWSWEMRYLSNTAGDISTTPWTNKVYVGRWYSTDNISIRWLADFSLDNVSYSNLSFSWPSQEEVFYLSWWWLLNFSSSTNLWSSSIVSLSYQISKDWIWWTTLWTISSTSWGNETSQNSISIPANHYFRWSFGQDLSLWTATVTNINLIPF